MAALALGTVQFGMTYGVANQSGQVSPSEVAAILAFARPHGVDTVDTAVAYGDSERRLGEAGVEQWRVVSKLPPITDSCPDARTWVQETVRGSLERLRITRLHGLLLHRSKDLLGPQGAALYRGLQEARGRGEILKIGVSVYDPAELEALEGRFDVDLVQAPFNIIDRRFATSGWLERLHAAGTEVHVRSVFLQGLLLMDETSRPARFTKWPTLWSEWSRWLSESALSPLQACLGFAFSQPQISRVVVGVDRRAQLQEIIESIPAHRVVPPATLSSTDPDLINPLSWITT